MSTQTPVREGLFTETASGPTLLASRCDTCGHTAYPATARCLACGAEDLETVEIGDEGDLLCASVVHMGNGRFAPGYVVGYVVIDGIRVFAQLDTGGEEPPPPGTSMTLEIVPLWQQDDTDVLAPRFVPTSSASRTSRTSRKESADA
ncbi:MAG TPA: zinc ribbon domain-containing protein [Marmoricola sp.]